MQCLCWFFEQLKKLISTLDSFGSARLILDPAIRGIASTILALEILRYLLGPCSQQVFNRGLSGGGFDICTSEAGFEASHVRILL